MSLSENRWYAAMEATQRGLNRWFLNNTNTAARLACKREHPHRRYQRHHCKVGVNAQQDSKVAPVNLNSVVKLDLPPREGGTNASSSDIDSGQLKKFSSEKKHAEPQQLQFRSAQRAVVFINSAKFGDMGGQAGHGARTPTLWHGVRCRWRYPAAMFRRRWVAGGGRGGVAV